MVKKLILFVMAAPAGAWAGHLFGSGKAGCLHGDHGCGHLAAIAMAGLAVLGWWVLHKAEKDHPLPKWAGRVTGGLLVLAGLVGFLCGSICHWTKGAKSGCAYHSEMGSEESSDYRSMTMPPGHPPISGESMGAVDKPTKSKR